jgi:hypothetical protein
MGGPYREITTGPTCTLNLTIPTGLTIPHAMKPSHNNNLMIPIFFEKWQFQQVGCPSDQTIKKLGRTGYSLCLTKLSRSSKKKHSPVQRSNLPKKSKLSQYCTESRQNKNLMFAYIYTNLSASKQALLPSCKHHKLNHPYNTFLTQCFDQLKVSLSSRVQLLNHLPQRKTLQGKLPPTSGTSALSSSSGHQPAPSSNLITSSKYHLQEIRDQTY